MPVIYHPESDCYFVGDMARLVPDADAGSCREIAAHRLSAGTRIQVGTGVSTALPDMDFEAYSEAGLVWNEADQKWGRPPGATKGGIAAVGAAAYASHPSTQVLSLAYDLKDSVGPRLWLPWMPPPADLFAHIARGGLLEAWYCSFEWWIWTKVCRDRMGWPDLPFWQLRDAPAKARAFSYPGKLENAGKVSGAAVLKDKDGDRLIKKFCVPRKPTKGNPSTRILPEDDPVDFDKFTSGYNLTDIAAESAVSALCPDLIPDEQTFELCTRASNVRGVGVDIETARAGVAILEQALERYNAELCGITGGTVSKASEVQKLIGWLGAQGVHTSSLDADALDSLMAEADRWPPVARRALEIRQLVGSASVKKLYAIARQAVGDRLHDLFIYHGARTGRDTGADVQPQNLPKAGPALYWCENDGCGRPYGQHRDTCPHCGASSAFARSAGWSWEAVDHAITVIRSGSLDEVERVFGDALLTLSGCIRGLFVAAEGKDLICSDYSSIEAVVTAMLAGERWRVEAFRRKEDIYLVSAGRITGRTLEEYSTYKAETGAHHPDRQKIGKPAELGLGFGGWVNAWYQFDKSGTFAEEEVKRNIVAWRNASPAIVELWGGQVRGKPWAPDRAELYGLEGAAIAAVQNPGTCYSYRGVSYGVRDDVLFCRLPSGRSLVYHRPRLVPSTRWEGQLSLSYEGWNSNPKMGPIGWIRIETYGGRLTENVVQAVARDFMRDAGIRLERAGYPIVLRVHDELAAEVPESAGSIEEFERIMAELPAWALEWGKQWSPDGDPTWPVRASGGWRGKRYRKD